MCPICGGEVTWDHAWKFYECRTCNRRWLEWPPPYAARIMANMRHLKTESEWYEFWRVFPNGRWR